MENELNNIEKQTEEVKNEIIKDEELSKSCDNKNNKCLKNIDLFYKIFVVLAILILFVLHFFNKKENKLIGENGSVLKIAYINTDSIFNNYLMVKDLKEELKTEKDKLEAEVMTKQKAFDQKLKNYQSNMQSNSINAVQAQNAEKNLMNERNEILSISEKYSQDLAFKELQITKQITDSIVNYTKRFNSTFQADYILGYTYGAGIIVANEKFDISKRILEGLNKEYKK